MTSSLKILSLYYIYVDPYEHLHQPLTERRAILVRNDIRSLLSIHEDQQFTGRSVARILQGTCTGENI